MTGRKAGEVKIWLMDYKNVPSYMHKENNNNSYENAQTFIETKTFVHLLISKY